MKGTRQLLLTTVLLLIAAALAACSRTVGGGDPDVESARTFAGYPLYWVGERFEEWDLEYVAVRADGFTTFSYGTCEIEPFSDQQ